MSQKKVEQYKEYKKNREAIWKKQRRARNLELALVSLVGLIFVGWLGFSIYNLATRPAEGETQTAQTIEWDLSAYDEYLATLE